ncbi:DUF4304 domain-containing protein [Streptomyces sp. NPDC048270]|uniref:DUF4304 domain-containing protein n=1 Tax=Streptomyces sp. NPDC048270 TaxID=3154615 RepID=UPI0033F3DB8C
MNATDLFHQMLRRKIAPALRDAGFTGTGLEYRLRECAPDHALVGFQRSAGDGDGAERCRFTVNLRAALHEDHEALRRRRPALGSRISANRVGPVGWHMRIGQLLGHPHDHWWTITDERSADRAAEDVLALVLRHGVPALWAGLLDLTPGHGPALDPVPECLDPHCFRSGAGGPRPAAGAPAPEELEDAVVVEVGERRSSYVVTFLDESRDRESRLRIDASWRLEQPLFGWVRVGYGIEGDVRTVPSAGSSLPANPLALLGELTLCRVESAQAAPDGSLLLAFEPGTPRETGLIVAGSPHALALDKAWHLEAWTEVR